MTQPVDYEEGKRLLKGIVEQKAHISTDPAIAYDGYEQGLLESRRELLSRFMLTHAEALLNPDPWRGIEELPEEWKDGRWIEAVVAESADDGARLTPGRVFVIRHDGVTQSGYNMGWSVYPGYGGAHDRTFSHFRELKGPGHA